PGLDGKAFESHPQRLSFSAMTPDDSPPAGHLSRLPPPPFSPLTWDPVGSLVMRPWYDRLAVKLVAGWYLGMSRAWAAAQESGGDAARFAHEVGLDRLPGGYCGWSLARGLAATTGLAKVHAGADAHWRDVFFGPERPGDAVLVAAERRRRQAAHDLMAARRHFACLRRRIEPLCW